MTTTSVPATAGLRTAIEARDTDGILAWYADDATLTILDRDHPPASPTVYSGLAAIRGYFADVCGRDMRHEVRDIVATQDGLAFTQHRAYPDGTSVVCVTVARTSGGRIQRQTAVQVWDG